MPAILSTDLFEAIRQLIARRAGIMVPGNKAASLESKLASHLDELGIADYNAYLQRLTMEQPSSPMWLEVFRRVSTNETFFFRNAAQIKALTDVIMPEVMAHHEKKLFKRLKVWSAACSTGEEPYTLAMQLQQVLGQNASDWNPRVLATDIDTDAIKAAMNGHYTGRALTNVPKALLNRHFQSDGDGYKVNASLRSMVTFKPLNFADDREMTSQINMDIVFCRNVLIYFDIEFRQQVVTHLYNALRPGGFLVIGHSESLRGVHDGFTSIRCPGTLIYQRPEE
jgi:chemotaxis protein methyltransferase CheR